MDKIYFNINFSSRYRVESILNVAWSCYSNTSSVLKWNAVKSYGPVKFFSFFSEITRVTRYYSWKMRKKSKAVLHHCKNGHRSICLSQIVGVKVWNDGIIGNWNYIKRKNLLPRLNFSEKKTFVRGHSEVILFPDKNKIILWNREK